MIKFSNMIIDKTIKYLNEHYPVDEDIYIKVVEGLSCLGQDDDENISNEDKCYGTIDPVSNIIYIPSAVNINQYPDKNSYWTYDREIVRRIVHEYVYLIYMCLSEEEEEDYDEERFKAQEEEIIEEILSDESED